MPQSYTHSDVFQDPQIQVHFSTRLVNVLRKQAPYLVNNNPYQAKMPHPYASVFRKIHWVQEAQDVSYIDQEEDEQTIESKGAWYLDDAGALARFAKNFRTFSGIFSFPIALCQEGHTTQSPSWIVKQLPNIENFTHTPTLEPEPTRIFKPNFKTLLEIFDSNDLPFTEPDHFHDQFEDLIQESQSLEELKEKFKQHKKQYEFHHHFTAGFFESLGAFDALSEEYFDFFSGNTSLGSKNY